MVIKALERLVHHYGDDAAAENIDGETIDNPHQRAEPGAPALPLIEQQGFKKQEKGEKIQLTISGNSKRLQATKYR